MNSYLLGFRLARSIDNVIYKKSGKTWSFVEEQVKVELLKEAKSMRTQLSEPLSRSSKLNTCLRDTITQPESSPVVCSRRKSDFVSEFNFENFCATFV